ncbi:MAG: carbamoyl-phosphate synthase (glutamine-hydrolyzing) large subunit [Candidatus Aminicenantes bacterium]|nr:carbamoyl-phosphate synthase (glutamine-hydrolyzing) large subunit [Candidatus Aminicenantes bacterium]
MKKKSGGSRRSEKSGNRGPVPQKVLLLGSGALKIGEAGEFDYSGSQAIKALKEEGLEVVLINPNIATVQTSDFLADKVYFLPVTPPFVEKVIARERPGGILLSFGGQTALNCGIALAKSGVLRRWEVRVLGTPVSAIENTEDRERFNARLAEAGLKSPRGLAATSIEMGLRIAKEIGYPVMARVAYALGGRGSGLSRNAAELKEALRRAFAHAPQVLIEEYLEGWKEVEYEVVRDADDNCIAVCNMENFDPMGIHTGESIVIAPSQTLSNKEYHVLREISIRAVRRLGLVGEGNIQFALNPRNGDYRIIEVNARLSRSSALASKATGYPLAFIAAKLALGHSLPSLQNSVTKRTTACFEPALDYLVVKIPRWDLKKFRRVSKKIGSEMKSVGEVMAVGRSFEEALQKATRMLQIGMYGVVGNPSYSFTDLEKELRQPTDERLFGIAEALKKGWTVDRIHHLTKIDRWFITKIRNIVDLEANLRNHRLAGLPRDLLTEAKKKGFSDKQIAIMIGAEELEVRARRERLKVRPSIKQIDTLAAEYPAKTNYLYLTYHGSEDDVAFERRSRKVMVLGSGSYSIGSSVEFDWCCVSAVLALKKLGFETIMVNYNPETVSTDYDICDRLYFEELSFERVLDIHKREKPRGVVLSMGGQIPNNIALKCHAAGMRILGTPAESIDRAENRFKFSKLLDGLGVDQPAWRELRSAAEAAAFSRAVGFPVLVRPSYVLSGAAMSVVFDPNDLDRYLKMASRVSPEYPVVVSKYILNAKEIELDAVAKDGRVVASAVVEHVENAGVHSGDATMVLPPQKTYIETMRRVQETGRRIASALRITGPFNIQFLAKDNEIKVIECNLRASRSFPFVSKVTRTNFVELAVEAMMGRTPRPVRSTLDLNYVGVKAPQFSFSRLHGADPTLGVEMASTGEVACLGDDVQEAFLKSLLSAGYALPRRSVLLSLGGRAQKHKFLAAARTLQGMGLSLYATDGTSAFLKANGVANTRLHKIHERRRPNIRDYIAGRKVDFVISTPDPERKAASRSGYELRRMAVDYSVPLLTNLQVAELFVQSLAAKKAEDLPIKSWGEYL